MPQSLEVKFWTNVVYFQACPNSCDQFNSRRCRLDIKTDGHSFIRRLGGTNTFSIYFRKKKLSIFVIFELNILQGSKRHKNVLHNLEPLLVGTSSSQSLPENFKAPKTPPPGRKRKFIIVLFFFFFYEHTFPRR